jgi:hypothetical protein
MSDSSAGEVGAERKGARWHVPDDDAYFSPTPTSSSSLSSPRSLC